MSAGQDQRRPWAGLALMAVFGLWAGGLGIGFGVIAAVSADRLGPVRLVLYVVVCAFLVLTAARTLYELARRLRSGQ